MTKRRQTQEGNEGVIRFGMMAVRGVGEKAVEAIIDERKSRGEFRSLFDFAERVDLRQVQKSTIDALIKCGAFASLKARRAQLLHVLDGAVEARAAGAGGQAHGPDGHVRRRRAERLAAAAIRCARCARAAGRREFPAPSC
jgi:DNA polymerase-3 subunit alpha